MNEPTDPKAQIAALFAAPDDGRTDAVDSSDPLGQLGEEERELARLRLMPVNELVLEYLGKRDHLDHERHVYNALEAKIKGELATMSMVMREKADALGVDAFPIRGVGTAYRNVKTSYRVADWETYIAWVISTGNTQCVEKRAAKLAVAEVHRALGSQPPGLDFVQEVEFLVRRNKA